MKYFLQLMYDGQSYAGWQKQPNATGVQAIIENRMSRILQTKIDLVGCGRTDAGVHALKYYAHTEIDENLDENFLFRLNNFLPADIAVSRVLSVHEEAHARFDAIERSYVYHIHYKKNPFREKYSFYFQRAAEFKIETLNEFSQKLTSFEDFSSFAKFHSDVYHHRCNLTRCEWKATETGLELHISSDRFLRGMVRLIAGACLRYAEGRTSMADLESAMETKTQITGSWAVPAQGLFLSEIKYPYIK